MKKLLILISSVLLVFFSGCSKAEKSDEPKDTTLQAENNVKDETKYYEKISEYLKTESEKTFSPYYEMLGYEITSYEENGNEALIGYCITHKNYDKDPDTVEYIKEAKEKNDPNYKTYYDEYLKPQIMNMYFKAVIDSDGNITLYTDDDPTGKEEWNETKMQDFIIS